MFAKTALIALAVGAQISLAAPVQQEKRGIPKLVPALVGAGASYLTGQVLNNKRAEPSLMIDTETGELYLNMPDANERRSIKGLGATIAGGIATGAATGVASSVFDDIFGDNKKRAPASGLMIDTETGDLYMEVPDANSRRALKPLATALAGGVASGAASSLFGDLFGNNEKRSEELDARDFQAIGSLFKDIFGKRGEQLNARNFQGGIGNNALSDFLASHPELSPFSQAKRDEQLDARALGKLGNIFQGLFGKRSEELNARALLGLIPFIENIFNKRSEELDARDFDAIKNFIGGLFGKRDEPLFLGYGPELSNADSVAELVNNLGLAKRAIDDLE